MHTISIALCTFNGAQYLEAQLDSFVSQARQPDELIVCDDGSSDRTLEIIDLFSRKAPFNVKLFVNSNKLGITKNFEKAIQLCTGDLIALSDQDDVWHPEKIERCEQLFSVNADVGAIFTNADVVDEALNSLGYDMWQKAAFTSIEQKKVSDGMALEVLLKHFIVTGATLIFRADYKKIILPIPRLWFHDAWIALLIASISRLSFINDPMIKYRQHSANQLGGVNKTALKQIRAAFQVDRSEYYDLEISRYHSAIDRLFTIPDEFDHTGNIAPIQEKVKHLEFRGSMHKNRFMRIPAILKELTQMRYHRYARNWGSIAMDLLFK